MLESPRTPEISTTTELNNTTNKSKSSSFYKHKDNYFNILSQNVRGSISPDKIEEAINLMENNNIDVYLLQETCTTGPCSTTEELRIHNHIIFLHGSQPDTTPTRGGVGIILGPRAIKSWKKAGALPPQLGETTAKSTRFMSIEIQIKHNNTDKRITLVSAYHPHSKYEQQDLDQYYVDYNNFLSRIPPKNKIIIGCDANTTLGVATKKSEKAILGKYGIKRTRDNDLEQELRAMMYVKNVRSSTSDFKHKRYDTFSGAG